MNDLTLTVETNDLTKPATAEIIELTIEQLDKVGGGVAYVLI